MEVTPQEQRSYVKIAVLRGRNAKECHSELTEALDNRALPYRTVARWAAAFQHGRIANADMRLIGRPRTVRTGIDQATVHKILREDLRSLYVILLQSGCHMHLLNNKNGVAMKLVVFIWKCIKMERTC